MAEKDYVEVTNTGDIGKQVASKLNRGKLSNIENQLKNVNNRLSEVEGKLSGLEDLDEKIDELKQRIERIEETKARAEREALESLKSELDTQLQEKKEEYQRRLQEVLSDYRNSVETLKERFVDNISGREENFTQVEEEFDAVRQSRSECFDATVSMGETLTSNYEDRKNAIMQSREAFLSATDEFIADREDTAATIDSLQTSVRGINSSEQITIPFWVVGIKNGDSEEIRVLPVQSRDEPSGSLERDNPYLEYLKEHDTHSYGDMTDEVQRYVNRDSVRNSLARREGEFADPEFLTENDIAMSRFVEALREFELASRDGGATTSTTASKETEPAETEEVTADD